MSRQLRISDDVHEMLTLLKSHPSASYDDVIRELIDDVCPTLQRSIDHLKLLEKESPRKAIGERLLLQKELYDNIIIERMLRQREADDERQENEHITSLMTEEQRKEEEEWEELNERRRELLRERMLRENENEGKQKK